MSIRIVDPPTSIGSIVIGGNPNSILYIDASGNLAQDTLFTYDDTTNSYSISNTFSSDANYTQSTGLINSTRNITGDIVRSTIGQSISIVNADALSPNGKTQSASYYASFLSAKNNGRTLSGTVSITENIAGIRIFDIESAGVNSITNNSTVTVNRYGVSAGILVADTLNNASLVYNGNIYGAAFAAQASITNTSSSSRTLNVYGVAGSADIGVGVTPNNCYGGYFTGSGAISNYGAYLSGATAAAYCDGNIHFSLADTYGIGESSARALSLYCVDGDFSGNIFLDAASQIDWGSGDITLYRNASAQLTLTGSLRVNTCLSVGTAIDTNIGVLISKTYSTDTSHYGVQGSCTFTGGNTTSTNVFTGLYGSVYLNAGANTFNNAYGVFGTSIIAPGQSGTISNVYGLNFAVSNQSTSSAPVTNLTGARVAIVSAGASVTGTITNAFGFDVASSNNTSSAQVITNFIGIRVNYAIPAGNTTTYRGIYVQNPTQNTGTTQRGLEIWTSSGTSVSAATTVEGLKINAVTSGGAWTTQYGIRISDLSYASTNYALYFDGTSGLSRQGIWWNADTNLYRSAADTLKTDDAFICANLTNSGLTAGRIVFTSTGGLLASDGGLLYDGTTVTLTDVLDAGGAVSVEIPNGAGGTTVDATGEICVDSTSRTVNFYDGTAEVVLDPLIEHAMYLESPTSADDIPILRVDKAMTLVKTVYAITGGTNWIGQLQEADDAQGTNSADTQTADSTVTGTTTVTSYSNASFDAGDYVRLKTTSVSGTVSWLHVTFYFRTNP